MSAVSAVSSPISTLNVELLDAIFDYLSEKIGRVALVCREWHTVAMDERRWAKICQKYDWKHIDENSTYYELARFKTYFFLGYIQNVCPTLTQSTFVPHWTKAHETEETSSYIKDLSVEQNRLMVFHSATDKSALRITSWDLTELERTEEPIEILDERDAIKHLIASCISHPKIQAFNNYIFVQQYNRVSLFRGMQRLFCLNSSIVAINSKGNSLLFDVKDKTSPDRAQRWFLNTGRYLLRDLASRTVLEEYNPQLCSPPHLLLNEYFLVFAPRHQADFNKNLTSTIDIYPLGEPEKKFHIQTRRRIQSLALQGHILAFTTRNQKNALSCVNLKTRNITQHCISSERAIKKQSTGEKSHVFNEAMGWDGYTLNVVRYSFTTIETERWEFANRQNT